MTQIYRANVTEGRDRLIVESVPLSVQASEEALLQNLGNSPRADTIVTRVAPMWVRKAFVLVTFGCTTRTAGLTAEREAVVLLQIG